MAALDRDLAVANVRTLEQVVADSIGERRFTMLLLGMFGGVALLLAVVGIYGVTAYGVAQRTREMGIRLALGAAPGAVRWLVLGEGLRLAALGLGAGLLLALAGARVIRSQLYGVGSADPATYVALAGVLLLVAAAATWIPARRATRVDPAIALRAEWEGGRASGQAGRRSGGQAVRRSGGQAVRRSGGQAVRMCGTSRGVKRRHPERSEGPTHPGFDAR